MRLQRGATYGTAPSRSRVISKDEVKPSGHLLGLGQPIVVKLNGSSDLKSCRWQLSSKTPIEVSLMFAERVICVRIRLPRHQTPRKGKDARCCLWKYGH